MQCGRVHGLANICSVILRRVFLPAARGSDCQRPHGDSSKTTRLRPIAEPFVAARPSGARIRTRLSVGPDDEAVLVALGAHLGFRSWDETSRRAAGRVL